MILYHKKTGIPFRNNTPLLSKLNSLYKSCLDAPKSHLFLGDDNAKKWATQKKERDTLTVGDAVMSLVN